MEIHYSNCISWQLLDDKVYIINEKTSEIHILDNTAKDFWLLINDVLSFNKIVEKLSNKYDIDANIIQDDMTEFKEEIISKSLISEGEYCYAR